MASFAEFSQTRLADTAYPALHDYRQVLHAWARRASLDWQPWPLVPRAGTFGPLTGGASGEAFAVRATAEYAAACAALWQEGADWPQRAEVWPQIVGSLRYVTSAFRLAKNESVSLHADFSPLWRRVHYLAVTFSPAALAARLIWNELNENDRAEAEYLVVSLANTLADAEIRATVEGHFSTPEQNAWNAELLLNACHMFPARREAVHWRERALCYLVNSFSRAADRNNEQMLDGRPIGERFVGANVHPNYSVEHHGAFHPNYMAHPIQRRGTIGLLCQWAAETIPESALYNVPAVFGVVKRLALWDGRLAHPSGQDHRRYVRPEHFLVPACVFVQHTFKDPDARYLERLTFRTLHWEQEHNGDGYFHARRLGQESGGPGITSLAEEANAAYNLALAYLMHKAAANRNTEDGIGNEDRETSQPIASAPYSLFPIPYSSGAEFEQRNCGVFTEPDAKVVFTRGKKAFASWSWRSFPGPASGLFVPRDGDHLAAWDDNMVSQYEVEGFDCSPEQCLLDYDSQQALPAGFAATGRIRIGRPGPGSGRPAYALAEHLAFAALPDEETAVLHTLVAAEDDLTITRERHLHFGLANDIFNGLQRSVATEAGDLKLAGLGEYARETVRSRWINVDGALSIVSLDPDATFTFERFPQRHDRRHSLAVNLVSCPYREGHFPYRRGEVVRRSAFVFLSNLTAGQRTDHAAGRARAITTGSDTVLATLVAGGHGQQFLVATNFGDQPSTVTLDPPFTVDGWQSLAGEGTVRDRQLLVPGRTTVLIGLAPSK